MKRLWMYRLDYCNVDVIRLYCVWLQVEFCCVLCETQEWFCGLEHVTRAPPVRTEEQMDEISAWGAQCLWASSTVLSSSPDCWRTRLQKLPVQFSCARLVSQFFKEKGGKKKTSLSPRCFFSPAAGPVVSAAASRTLNLHAVLLRDGERGFLPPPCFSFPSF